LLVAGLWVCGNSLRIPWISFNGLDSVPRIRLCHVLIDIYLANHSYKMITKPLICQELEWRFVRKGRPAGYRHYT
jgi:hypothetical protein